MNAILIFCQEETPEQKKEMRDLLDSAGIGIARVFEQNVKAVSRSTYIGKGKCEEIERFLQVDPSANVVVFSSDLSVMQARELERRFDRRVLDRTDLILHIFLEQAQSAAARLQIESALLRRQLNRLIGTNVHLTRQRGGVTNRGAGEKQLQLDKRLIKTRIAQIEKELARLQKQRDTQRASRLRASVPLVALAGYTNAGKSTVMNGFLRRFHAKDAKQVLQENRLFATLDTSVRLIEQPYGQSFLLVDTVGFLHDFPHELVRAFHSTLEDIQLATCVLHVVDASKPNYLDDIEATETTLEAIDAASIDRLVVFNQCDKTEIVHPAVHASQVYISALDPGDIDFLAGQVNERLFGEWVERETKIPYSDFSRYDTLRQTARILKTEEQEDGVLVRYQIRHRLEKNIQKG